MIIYSESFIEFLKNSECSIAKKLYKAHEAKLPAYQLMLTTKEVNYLTFRQDETISFLPAGKEHITNVSGDWARNNRQNGKAAKVIKKLFTEKAKRLFKDTEFESFSNAYKSNFSSDNHTFKLLSNKEIPNVYDMDRAEGDAGLNGSCMNNDTCYLDIYKYCEHLRILIMLNENEELCGRALVWSLDENITLMDRIYVSKEFMYESFLTYARKEGWWHKKEYKSREDQTSFIDSNGNEVNKNFTVYTNTSHSYYPYIDTFQYGDDGSLNNYSDGQYTYDETDGTRSGDNEHEGQCYDDIDEDWIDDDDSITIDAGQYRGHCTHIDNTVTVGDTIYWKDSEEIRYIDGEWYHVDDTCYSEYDEEYYLENDCVYSEIHETNILKSDAIKIEGEYYHTDDEDTIFLKIEDYYYLIEDERIEYVDGEYRLKAESEAA